MIIQSLENEKILEDLKKSPEAIIFFSDEKLTKIEIEEGDNVGENGGIVTVIVGPGKKQEEGYYQFGVGSIVEIFNSQGNIRYPVLIGW